MDSRLKFILKQAYVWFDNYNPFTLPQPRRRVKKSFLPALIWSVGLIFAAVTFYLYVLKDLPSPKNINTNLALTTHIRDRNGVELYKIYQNQNRTLVKLADLPDYVKQSIISIEDKNFYSHQGFSPTGTFRAFWRLVTNQRLEGGSTITQQLVKTSLLSPERTLRRKVRELILSAAIESLYSKDQILEMYLNRVSFGGSSYGIEEAAQAYFGKSAAKLTFPEAALLAGLPASPTTYSPFGLHPEKSLARQKEVLRRMYEDKFITWDEADTAANQNLQLKPPSQDILAPHFVMYVKNLLESKYGPEIVEMGGLDVTTSLDLTVQNAAQKIVTDETAKIKYLHIGNGAALVTVPGTGEILAMVGSRDYFDLGNDGNVNVSLASRQPGSSIKPINYAVAFSRNFTPASVIDDSPITYRFPGQPAYSPVNYDNRYHGRITLRTALACSYNVPAVKLLAANGVDSMIAMGQNLGLTTWSDPSRFGLSLTLGGGEVTMTDMAVVFGTFANSGLKVPLNPILKITDSRGKILYNSQLSTLPAGRQVSNSPVLDPNVAFLITDILADNNARAPMFGLHSSLNLPPHQVAVKTGTTNNLRDNWTIGYTKDFLTAVWVGNNDNSPMSYVASGVTGASPIWNKIMTSLLKDQPIHSFSPPENLKKIAICPRTGQLACDACKGAYEYFLPGTEPKSACTTEQFISPAPPQPGSSILQGSNVGLPLPAYTLPKPSGEEGRKNPRKR
jgi:penicillin-binding protein 1C